MSPSLTLTFSLLTSCLLGMSSPCRMTGMYWCKHVMSLQRQDVYIWTGPSLLLHRIPGNSRIQIWKCVGAADMLFYLDCRSWSEYGKCRTVWFYFINSLFSGPWSPATSCCEYHSSCIETLHMRKHGTVNQLHVSVKRMAKEAQV